MARAIIHDPEPESEIRVPPPVPDGTQYVESLGFIDRLVGTERDRRNADAAIAPLTMSPEEWASAGVDPEEVEVSDIVDDGDDIGVRSGKPSDSETK